MRGAALAVAAALLLPADDVSLWLDNGGAGASAERTIAPHAGPVRDGQRPPTAALEAGPLSESRAVIDCPGNTVDAGRDEAWSCQSAIDACRRSGEGPGPQSRLYTRIVGTTEWTLTGMTCLPDHYAAPAAPGVLTLGHIQRAFAETPFATPLGTVQPPGGTTLVNLPTYFALAWPTQGYRPGQIRSLTLLGHAVDLRLKTDGHVYDFGDGSSHGPTPSLGGPYPTGDVTHTYSSAATLTPTATTTITADYRVDAGPWQPLPGHSTQTTTFPALTIGTATNRLTADPA